MIAEMNNVASSSGSRASAQSAAEVWPSMDDPRSGQKSDCENSASTTVAALTNVSAAAPMRRARDPFRRHQ